MNLHDDMKHWEGEVKRDGTHRVYCDACGREWRECELLRESCLWGRGSGGDALTAKQFFAERGICPGGNMTIDWGINLEHGLTDEECEAVYAIRLRRAEEAVRQEFGDDISEKIGEARYSVLVNLAFNGGPGIFDEFPRFVEAVKAGRWDLAARELRYKHWKAGKNLDETAIYAGHPARWEEMCRRLVSGQFDNFNGDEQEAK